MGVPLPAGNASANDCLKACEAERTNGCCRLNHQVTAEPPPPLTRREQQYSKAPIGCALGHGRTTYDPGFKMAGRTDAVTTQCSGQAFVFYCEAAISWHLAPPSAWDVIDDEECYNTVTQEYRHSLAIGPDNGTLEDGFTRE